MSLRIRRGTEAQRTGQVFDLGELVVTTDEFKLFVGDGQTAGGQNIAQHLNGTGLAFNADTGKLDVHISLTTDDIAEGSNNKYFTVERAQDAVGAAIAAGTQTGITVTYNDNGDSTGSINFTVDPDQVGITSVSQDTTPALGGNLTLSSHNITGTGNIDITGSIKASVGLGGDLSLNTHSITGTGAINITGTATVDALVVNDIVDSNLDLNLNNINNVGSLFVLSTTNLRGVNAVSSLGTPNVAANFTAVTDGSSTGSWVEFNSSRNSVTAPTPLVAGDVIGGFRINGLVAPNTTSPFGLFAATVNATANISDPLPAGRVSIGVPNGTSMTLYEFNSNGLLQASSIAVGDGTASSPSIKFGTDAGTDTGFYHPGDGIVCVAANGQEKARFDSGGFRTPGFAKVGSFATGAEPSPAEEGMIIFDSDTKKFKGWNGTIWADLS